MSYLIVSKLYIESRWYFFSAIFELLMLLLFEYRLRLFSRFTGLLDIQFTVHRVCIRDHIPNYVCACVCACVCIPLSECYLVYSSARTVQLFTMSNSEQTRRITRRIALRIVTAWVHFYVKVWYLLCVGSAWAVVNNTRLLHCRK